VQLDTLWKFMEIDMEADRFENEMRQAPNRLKLQKQRNFLVEQQNNMKKIEVEVSDMTDRMEAVSDEAVRLEAALKKLTDELEANPPETHEEIQKQMAAAQKLTDTLSRYEQELQRMRKDGETRDRQQKEIRVRAAKTKAEFDQLKQVYNGEFARDSAKLNQLKARVEKEAAKVDPALLERYRAVKAHAMPPMAKLNSDRCGVCNMSLPSVVLHQVRSGEKLVECDNCGRILYVSDEE
jgi:predicted  nucleic acid-binding Zn-ribbon protein